MKILRILSGLFTGTPTSGMSSKSQTQLEQTLEDPSQELEVNVALKDNTLRKGNSPKSLTPSNTYAVTGIVPLSPVAQESVQKRQYVKLPEMVDVVGTTQGAQSTHQSTIYSGATNIGLSGVASVSAKDTEEKIQFQNLGESQVTEEQNMLCTTDKCISQSSDTEQISNQGAQNKTVPLEGNEDKQKEDIAQTNRIKTPERPKFDDLLLNIILKENESTPPTKILQGEELGKLPTSAEKVNTWISKLGGDQPNLNITQETIEPNEDLHRVARDPSEERSEKSSVFWTRQATQPITVPKGPPTRQERFRLRQEINIPPMQEQLAISQQEITRNKTPEPSETTSQRKIRSGTPSTPPPKRPREASPAETQVS